MMRTGIALCLGILAVGSIYAAETSTAVQYRFQTPTITFDTNYAIDPGAAESFLLDVASQRSLGTFQKTAVGSTDEFIPAVNKRLGEYQELSADLRRKAASTLPSIEVPKFHVVSLDDIPTSAPQASSGGSFGTSADARLTRIRQLLSGSDVEKGLEELAAFESLLRSPSGRLPLGAYGEPLAALKKDFFTPEGLLKGRALSNLGAAIRTGGSRDRFLALLLNRCMASPRCNQEKFRQIAAILYLFGEPRELIKYKAELEANRFTVGQTLAISTVVQRLPAAQKPKETCKIEGSCSTSSGLLRSTLTKVFNFSEDQSNELLSLTHP